jgi:carboxyl-terminal processing protease
MRNKAIIILVLVVSVLAFFSLASSGIERKKKDELYKQVELFSDALTIIQTDYVDEAKPKDLIYGALKGMLSSLDPHSQFMDPDAYNELRVDTEGKFGGLGIEITMNDGLLTIVTPIEDTPAWKAGIKANDRIVKINNQLTRDMTISDAVKLMRGEPGETVNLSILRESEKKLLDFKIVRDIIKINDIKESRIIDEGIGYIRLVEFREDTMRYFNVALEKLTKAGMSSLILDLRNNPGGLLDTAVEVCEKFIEKGKMVTYTKGRKPDQNMEFISGSIHPITNLPMVVLINEGSASGSEIVAGCLKDYKRAIIVGKKSFGKGSVQTVLPLADGSALRLTVSRYFTPSGKVIHGNGVIPDILAEDIQLESGDKNLIEGDIFKHIESKDATKKAGDFDYQKDAQLSRAVDALKAIMLYKDSNK